MSTSGYSGTPLLRKLGIKPSMKVALVNPPEDYYQLLENDISPQICRPGETPDFIHVFAGGQKEFERHMKGFRPFISRNTAIIIWVSWYKKSSGVATNITENDIRNYALAHGLVDVKVCAVSELWSGLKLVVPLKLR